MAVVEGDGSASSPPHHLNEKWKMIFIIEHTIIIHVIIVKTCDDM